MRSGLQQHYFIVKTRGEIIFPFQKFVERARRENISGELRPAFKCMLIFIAWQISRPIPAAIVCFMRQEKTRGGFFEKVTISIRTDVAGGQSQVRKTYLPRITSCSIDTRTNSWASARLSRRGLPFLSCAASVSRFAWERRRTIV